MKILLTALTFPPCRDGVATVVARHAKHFAEAGHRVCVATSLTTEPGPSLTDHQNVSVEQFAITGGGNPLRPHRGELSRYREFLENCDVDLVFCHAWQTWTTNLTMNAPMTRSTKRVIVSHGVSANSRRAWPRYAHVWLAWRAYLWRDLPRMQRAADCVVYLADRADNDRFWDVRNARRLGLRNSRFIPNGADEPATISEGENFRRRNGIERERVILSVGKFDELKNERGVVEGVLRSGLSDATLVLIGPVRNEYIRSVEREWLRARKSAKNLRLLVLCASPSDEIRAAYAAADLFVSCSKTECQPLVILDAMAGGVPFVSMEAGCIAELPGGVVASRAGEFAAAIRRVLEDEGERRRLGQAGRMAFASRFSWPSVLRRFDDLIAELTSE